jgi:DNA-binding transcriptional MerR regulator
MSPTDYSIADVSALTDTPVRTVRYYIAQGLLPSAGRTGPAARYDDTFVARLRAIRMLQEAHLPLSVIQTTLQGLDEAEMLEVVERPEQVPADSASDYVRRLLGDGSGPAAREQRAIYPGAASMAAPGAPALPAQIRAFAEPVAEPAGPDRSHWERIVVAPGVELHIRRPQSRISTRQVERLVAFAAQLFQKGAR